MLVREMYNEQSDGPMRVTMRATAKETMRPRAVVFALVLLVAYSLGCEGHHPTSSNDGGDQDGSLSADGRGSAAGDGGVTIDPNAFYVATNGDDNNPGTLALPFATLAHAQTAMRANSINKTTYIRSGTSPQPPMTAGTCVFGNSAGSSIALSAADQGETWSFYPPDGYGSAILDGQSTVGNSGGTGGNGVGCAFAAAGTSGVTIVGLQFERYLYAAFWIYQSSGVVLSDNMIHDTTSAVFSAAGIIFIASPGATVTHNLLHDLAYMGIVVSDGSTTGDQMSNSLVSGNVVLDACEWPAVSGAGNDENGGDCGGIYVWSKAASASTNVRVENNFVRDVNVSSHGAGDFGSCCAQGIYLDAGTSHVLVTGNIVTGIMSACFQINGGNDNVIANNVCDLGAAAGTQIVQYENHDITAMTGNVFEHNVVVAGSADGGAGFVGNSPPNPMTVANNGYFNYVGATVDSTSTGGAGADSSPTYVDPELSCWAPSMAAGSPVETAVSFPGITGSWGPPGYVLPMTGTAPSWPHGC